MFSRWLCCIVINENSNEGHGIVAYVQLHETDWLKL